jgi:hypothetical protein
MLAPPVTISMPRPLRPRISRRACLAVLPVLIAVLAACEGSTGSPRPSPSLIDLEFTPQPTTTPTVTASAAPSATAQPGWPTGWDASFCAMFEQAAISQELLVDVERALDERETRDARGLARELNATALATTALIEGIPAWEDGQPAVTSIAALMDLGARAGTEYDAYLTDDTRAALRRARNLGRENRAEVQNANDELSQLGQAGLVCTGVTLTLESP